MASVASATVAAAASPMSVCRTIQAVRAVRKSLPQATSVGLVPTMGALHEGHLSLIREARANNQVLFASIFVNPTQFAPGEDLDKYPRQLERDSQLLAELGVDHLFAPDSSTMYGPNHVTFVNPQGFDNTSEGRSRPGHFQGVATIVTKLFNIVQPTRAYFGQKDAAQCVLIRRIVHDLNMDISIHVMDTVRQEDGLAMSSRNAYLTPVERQAAPVLYRSLAAAQTLYREAGGGGGGKTVALSAEEIVQCVKVVLQAEPLVKEIQYVSVDDRETMQPLTQVGSEGAIVSLACQVGAVRLIDNIVLSPAPSLDAPHP